jgi:hypothetical protein
MKAIGTTYNVPRIRRGESCAKINHIANPCSTREAVKKTQNAHEPQLRALIATEGK